MITQDQDTQENQSVRVMFNEVQKSVDISPIQASSENSTIDQAFSPTNSSNSNNSNNNTAE